MYDLDALNAAVNVALPSSIYSSKLHFTPVTGSTNADAVAAARNGSPHGSVFLADEQTAGRGRGDHSWESAAGHGLYASVLLRPAMKTEHLPMVPLAAGLAAASAVSAAAGLNVDLRWPNDILIGDHKAGGILVEAKTDGSDVSWIVVGIGINVHQREFDPAHSTPATSLDLATGRTISRQALLISLLESLQQETGVLHDSEVLAAIPARVALSSSWLWNRRVQVHGPRACVGITRGLDENGFLLVETDTGIVTVQTGGIRAAE